MQPNEKITCPFCHEQSIAKKKTKFDGFTQLGEVLVCMLCNAELGPVESAATQSAAGKLAALLGAAPPAAARLAAAENEKRFCKDCRHFLPHPFVDRCELDNRPVEAMGDCEKYIPRS